MYQIELVVLDVSGWNQLTVIEIKAILLCKQICPKSFKNEFADNQISYISRISIISENEWLI